MNMGVFKGPLGYIPVGLSIAGAGLFLYLNALEFIERKEYEYYATRPVTQIFEAEVYVPDFKIGDDPLVVYNNQKHEDFIGDYRAEIYRADGTKFAECKGFEYNIPYETDDEIDPSKTTLSWYMNEDCSSHLKDGKHYLATYYTIKQEGRPVRYYKTISNIFTVSTANEEER